MDPQSLEPGDYLVYIKTQVCQHCGNVETWSELFRVYIDARSRNRANVLRAVSTLDPRVPVGYTRLQSKEVPCCSACATSFITPVPRSISSDLEWKRAVEEMAERAGTLKEPVSEPKRPPKPLADLDAIPDF